MKKVVKSLLIAILILAVGAGGFLYYRGSQNYKALTKNESVEEKARAIMDQPDFVPFEDLPQSLVDATIAIEDHRFYSHGALDLIGLARAAASQVVPGMLQSGGSTIIQQTVKNMYGFFDTSIDRKATEFFLARALDKAFTKQEILALYVNIINYGNGYTGIYEAAMGYFGMHPAYLSPAQCTILAGIPQSPANYTLTTHYEAAKARQIQVLDAMVEYGYLSQEQANTIYNTSIWE